jgi:two-component system LytT family response regulator
MKREGRKIRVVIADGDQLVRDCVRAAFDAESDMQVIADCCSVTEATSTIQAYRPDVVLLGVDMQEGNAFDVIEQVGPDRMPNVVFLAGSDENAARALDAHALDYITAPYGTESLAKIVAQTRTGASSAASNRNAEKLADFIANRDGATAQPNGAQRTTTRFMIRERDRIRFISADDVDWIEGARNYVRLHVGERTHLLRGPLTAIHAQLEPTKFARIHRSIIVNVERIGEVQPWVGGDYVAILRSGERHRVSRNFRDTVVRRALSA